MRPNNLVVATLFLLLCAPLIAHAVESTTTMTWIIMLNRAHSITYGGSCSDTNFHFKETDANYDPDIDGNGAKIKPSANPGTNPPASSTWDEQFVSYSTPCSSTGNNCAFDVNLQTSLPTSAATHNAEFVSTQYDNLDPVDGADANTIASVSGRFPAQKFVFKLAGNVHPQRIIDFNFSYQGSAIAMSNAITCADGAGTDRDMNFYIYNYTNSQYDLVLQRTGTGAAYSGNAPRDANAYMSINHYTLSDYVGVAPDNNITFLVRGVDNTSTGRFSCVITDRIALAYHTYTESTYCQSSTVAPMRIRNVGNTAINIDGNFSSAFSGVDTNIVLKVWRGTPFCGNTGFGGWEKDCSVTSTTIAPGTTTCKQFNRFNATTSSRLISSIAVDGNGSLCFSGDLNGFVGAGNHVKTFQTGSGV
ncbi:MAG: hypothetical protein IPJ89_00945 [Candidatus Iainarchaeum archaeon]|uniref:Uncharacterized protein n=1 Tax=Candidatus Iainarchaeum sp. TaxID=3101447 RepID=A0A7T9I195_9ARCH|nr:MAG: hypothetical protein IPJ89_00945 [Candidatus Diapherotrites archaeon]